MKKTNHVESLLPGSGEYSFMADLRLDLWAMVSIATHLVGQLFIKANPDWHVALRIFLGLLPLIPLALYGFKFKRFIVGLDELQRRKQIEVLLCAALGTLLIGIVVSVLNAQGVSTWKFEYGLGFVGVLFSLMILWLIGSYFAHWFHSRSDEK